MCSALYINALQPNTLAFSLRVLRTSPQWNKKEQKKKQSHSVIITPLERGQVCWPPRMSTFSYHGSSSSPRRSPDCKKKKRRVKNHHHTHQRNDFESSLQACKEVLKNGGSRRRKRSAKSKLERLLLASRLNIAWSANSNTEFEGTAEEKTIDVGGHRRGGLRAEVVKVRRVWRNQLKLEHFI